MCNRTWIRWFANFFASLLKRIPFFGKKIAIPIDIIVMRIIEVMNSLQNKSCVSEEKNQRQHRNKAQKEVHKSAFSLEMIFCIVKTEIRELPKT